MKFEEAMTQLEETVKKLEKKLIEHSSAIITSADSLKDNLIEKGADRKKITVIKNAVNMRVINNR